jgi:serine/threonine protein kinase
MKPGSLDSSSQVLFEDGERVLRRGWRVDDDGDRSAVLIVLPVAEHPSPSSLDRLAHEYGLKDELDEAWAARPLDLVRDGGRAMLVLKDPGGEPLELLLGAPMEVGHFLRLASGIATALGKLHQRGLVHKDIRPTNILINSATGEVRFTGFGIASRLSRQRQAIALPGALTGTLAYMAPEQTGRMNRSIDSRSDLYALGVTFYQMLTGVLPFAAADPLELVHCHLARRPVPPADQVKVIPSAVSAIIMRLLAKTAEERYKQQPVSRMIFGAARPAGRHGAGLTASHSADTTRPTGSRFPSNCMAGNARSRHYSPPSIVSSTAAPQNSSWSPVIPAPASLRS